MPAGSSRPGSVIYIGYGVKLAAPVPGPGITPGILAHTGLHPGIHTVCTPKCSGIETLGVHTKPGISHSKNLRATRYCECPDPYTNASQHPEIFCCVKVLGSQV